MDWARTTQQGPLQEEALRQFTFTLAKKSANSVTEHLEKLPAGPGKTAAIEGFAFATFDTDADAVLAWARLIKEEDRRYDILSRAWKRWRNDNRTGSGKMAGGRGELKPAEKAGIEAKLGR